MLMNPQWMKNDTTRQTVEVYPPDIVHRRWVRWGGIAAEIVRATRRERLEFHFRAPVHLLAVCDQGVRSDGDTFVEGLPRSKRRDVRRRLTFVPAGHAYHEWQEPRVLARMVYFYFDPAAMPTPVTLAPRLLFEDADLADTALKLTRLIEQGGPESGPYFDALGIVLAHELMRLDSRAAAPRRVCAAGSRPGSNARSPVISRTILPSRYHSPPWRGWRASARIISAGPSSNRSACRRIAITTVAASSAPRHCWRSPCRR